jgi:hypothetical protein
MHNIAHFCSVIYMRILAPLDGQDFLSADFFGGWVSGCLAAPSVLPLRFGDNHRHITAKVDPN